MGEEAEVGATYCGKGTRLNQLGAGKRLKEGVLGRRRQLFKGENSDHVSDKKTIFVNPLNPSRGKVAPIRWGYRFGT